MNTPRAMTREDMDRAFKGGCAVPGCNCKEGPMYIHSKCHPKADVMVCYWNGEIRIECAKCKELICFVKVHDGAVKLGILNGGQNHGHLS